MLNFKSINTSIKVFLCTYLSLKQSHHPQAQVEALKTRWALDVLDLLNVRVTILGQVSQDPSLLLIGNHISYLDIPLLMGHAPNSTFVAKNEISKWPLFGKAAQAADTIFVKRDNQNSRLLTRDAIHAGLQNGKRIIIFPSGTTSLSEDKPWKSGAFKIAQETQGYVQPFRISYSPLREAAYIDQDFFPLHLYRLAGTKAIEAQIEFHEPVKIKVALEERNHWQRWSQQSDLIVF